MNVSISAVVHDLHTTVSSVQSAIALEALVSAAFCFILIGSKVGDLFGRKRAYVLGLLGYAIGVLAMALAQSLTAVIVFWAIIGGLGLSILGMGGIVLGILVWQEGGGYVGPLIALGAVAMAGLIFWLRRRKREGKPMLLDPDLFKSAGYRFGISQQLLQQIALGAMMIALLIYLQIVLE